MPQVHLVEAPVTVSVPMLYVKHVPPRTTPDSLIGAFSNYGPVTGVSLFEVRASTFVVAKIIDCA